MPRIAGRSLSSCKASTPRARTASSSTSCRASILKAARCIPSRQPSAQEIDHDFLWRASVALPRARHDRHLQPLLLRGDDRRARASRAACRKQNLPQKLITDDIWSQRFDGHQQFRIHLARNGMRAAQVLSEHVQGGAIGAGCWRASTTRRRAGNSRARCRGAQALGQIHRGLSSDTISNTATKDAPWYVVPADHKWFTRLVVAAALVERLEALDLKFPKLDDATVARARDDPCGVGRPEAEEQ